MSTVGTVLCEKTIRNAMNYLGTRRDDGPVPLSHAIILLRKGKLVEKQGRKAIGVKDIF